MNKERKIWETPKVSAMEIKTATKQGRGPGGLPPDLPCNGDPDTPCS